MRTLALKIIRALNAQAQIIEADYGRVPLAAILDTGRFDYERAHQHPLWCKELHEPIAHHRETEEYGVSSIVYRARRPFDPTRFHRFTERSWPGLIRAKGHFWLATRPNWAGEISVAGSICHIDGMGFWWAAIPKARWPQDDDWRARLMSHWSPVRGDRRQELVFIGVGVDEAAIRAELDACLLGSETQMKFEPDAYLALRIPSRPGVATRREGGEVQR